MRTIVQFQAASEMIYEDFPHPKPSDLRAQLPQTLRSLKADCFWCSARTDQVTSNVFCSEIDRVGKKVWNPRECHVSHMTYNTCCHKQREFMSSLTYSDAKELLPSKIERISVAYGSSHERTLAPIAILHILHLTCCTLRPRASWTTSHE